MKEYCEAVESFDSQIKDIEDPTKRKTKRKTKLIDYLDYKLDDLKLLRHKCNCILQGFNYILNLRTNKKEDVNLTASLINIINKKYVEDPNTFFIQDQNGEYVECEYIKEQ